MSARTKVASARTEPGAPSNVTEAGTRMKRASVMAARARRLDRSGSGTVVSRGFRRLAWPIRSGSPTIPGARRATRRSSAGSTQVTSGIRAWRNSLKALSAQASPRSRGATAESPASAAGTSRWVMGRTGTFCPVNGVTESGATGRASGSCAWAGSAPPGAPRPPQARARTRRKGSPADRRIVIPVPFP